MKKAIALLLAFALIGGAAFAQDAAAPVATGLVDVLTTAPTVTYGVDAGLDHNAVAAGAAVMLNAADGTEAYEKPLQADSTYFFSTPWVKIAYGNFAFTGKYYWDPQGYLNLPSVGTDGYGEFNNAGATQMLEGGFAYTHDALTLKSTFYMDAASTSGEGNGIYNLSSFKATSGNVEATFGVVSAVANDTTQFGFSDLLISDASFTVKKMFDLWTMKVGGSGSNMLRIGSIQTGSPFYSVMGDATTVGRVRIRDTAGSVGALTTVIGMNTSELPVINTIDLAAFELPVTVYVGSAVPYASTLLRDWFAGQKLTVAGKYALENVGSFDLGYIAGLGYANGLTSVGPLYYTGSRTVNNNTIFADAKIDGLVSGLTALVAFDLNLSEFSDIDAQAAAIVAGKDGLTVANATPYTYLGSTKFNFGVELKYDMAAFLEGLSLDGGVYLLGGSGKTYANQTAGTDTFAQYLDATYPTATWFRMANFTEAAYNQQTYYAGNPLKGFLKATYALDDTFSFWIRDVYKAKAGALTSASTTYASATLQPVGYYDSNEIKVGTDITQGNATISLAFAYTGLLGLPTAAQMGYTDSAVAGTLKTAADQAFAEAPATVRAPWSFNVVYTIAY